MYGENTFQYPEPFRRGSLTDKWTDGQTDRTVVRNSALYRWALKSLQISAEP